MSLRKKITVAILSLVGILMAILMLVVFFSLRALNSSVRTNSDELGRVAEQTSSQSMTEQITTYMNDVTLEKALNADDGFQGLKTAVNTIADSVNDIYANETSYKKVTIQEPDKANDGSLAVQLLYSSEIENKNDPAIVAEAGLLGNATLALKNINGNNDNIVSNYIATETGLMIQADYISGSKFDENGEVLPYEAKTRPWYVGAKNTGDVFFTSVSRDAHGTGNGIMCGVPFYKDGQLMGVAGAGMYLNNIKSVLMDNQLGETGYSCVINSSGQIIFSSYEEGIFAVRVEDDTDIRTECSDDLKAILDDALSFNSGVAKAKINDVDSYIAYAPMETVGWSYITIMSEEEVMAPTNALMKTISEATDSTISINDKYIKTIMIILMAVAGAALVVAVLVSIFVSKSISKPIVHLTNKVREISGDNLDFKWDMNTTGETQILAENFISLTDRMKKYVDDITAITAEKERIGAELNVATKIQADMLPSIFPAFPARNEFDIYATMTPAKEVGGDFYDFFMTDNNHLAMVMADVSGKGVPAALFMVISKTLLKNTAQNGLEPAEILAKVNDLLCENNEEMMFVTVWLGILDITTGEMVYANGGHEYPAVCHGDGQFELVIQQHDLVLAAMEGVPYNQYKMKLEPGDRFFIYTDGVPEATNTENELYGTDRMLDALNSTKECSLENVLKGLKMDIDKFAGTAPQFDDITMLEFVYNGPSADNNDGKTTE